MLPLLRLRLLVRHLLHREAFEHGLDEELRAHLDLLIDEQMARGATLQEARRLAAIELGGVEQVKEQVRSRRVGYFFDCLAQDLKFGCRMLRKNPAYTIFVVLILGLAIGANASVFSIAQAIFLSPLPQVGWMSRLVSLRETLPDGSCCQIPPASFAALRQEEGAFARLAVYDWKPVTLIQDSIPMPLRGVEISQDFFPLFGGSPALGRGFLEHEYEPGHPVVVISHQLWRRRFDADPQAVGKTLRMNGVQWLIVGVMGEDFDFPPSTDLWLPLAYDAAGWTSREPGRLYVVAEMRHGMDLNAARGAMGVLARRLARDYPGSSQGVQFQVDPLRNRVNGNLTPLFTMTLAGAAAFFLLLTCANLANLQLARAPARRQEMRIRESLGAGRGRTLQQLLTENLLLISLGCLLGILLGEAGIRLLIAGMPPGTGREITGWSNLRLGGPVLVLTLALTLLTSLASGLAPLWRQTRPASPGRTGMENRRTTQGRTQRRMRSFFVAAQISLALVLLVGAGLMIKGFQSITRSSDAFDPSTLLTLHLVLPESRYPSQQDRSAYLDRALERLSSLPGVTASCAFSSFPLSNNGVIWWEYRLAGQDDASRSYGAILQNVSPGFFDTLHLRLLAGRDFSRMDVEGSLPVAIVSESLARRRWPQGSPLGERIKLGKPDSSWSWLTIVGVASDTEFDWTDNATEPAIYLPYLQSASAYSYLALRASGPAADLADTVRRELAGLDPELPLDDVQTLGAAMEGSFGGLAEIGGTLVLLGLISMAIAVIGVYAVMAYSVGQRTNEIGIRMALGATPSGILRMVFRQGASLTLIALAIGVAGALAITRLVSGFFFGVSPNDPATFAGITLLLAGAALLACWLPARRAMRVEPLVALRYE
jgi:putative ABC transport system permease protein